MAGWSIKEHKLSTGRKGLKSWAKAAGGRVMTSSGWTVDFLQANFDVKHLHIVTDSTPIAVLQNLSQQRRNVRHGHALLGNNGLPVGAASTNSILALTEGGIAAWGAKIAKFVSGHPHSHLFQGRPQWDVTVELTDAAFLTHNGGGVLKTGLGVTATVTCEVPAANFIVICHFVAAQTGAQASLLPGDTSYLSAAVATKREERFKRHTQAEDTDPYDLGALFG